jgi:AraC-like DNA-binding protein
LERVLAKIQNILCEKFPLTYSIEARFNINFRPIVTRNQQASTPTLRISERFPDVSVLGQEVGFDLGFRQLDSGDASIPAQLLVGENLTLAHMHFGCGYHQLGLPPVNRLSFGVPVRRLRDWFGRPYRSSSILPFHHPGGIDGVSGKGFEAFTVTLSEDYLADIGASYRIPIPKQMLGPKPESLIDRGENTLRFRSQLNRLFSDPDIDLSREQEDELVITLLQAAHGDHLIADRSSARLRTRAVNRALAYVADHPDEIISVREICSENGIALRTLNRAFNERFGIGPKAYLNRRRLSAVRNDLLRSPPGTSVTRIANRWGFWHMGQFAKDYRNLFGELPSRTMGK